MARLSAAERLKLPDRAFAYIDSNGTRRLPIIDAAHVRNALARFDQVKFEDDRARDAARTRLLRAAKRFRIVPVGFISNQLRSERALGEARTADIDAMPTGFVTMLMSDIEGSTALLDQLGDDYGELLAVVREVQRTASTEFDGRVVEERADEFFAVFESPRAAVEAAIAAQRRLDALRWAGDTTVRLRVGIHAGYPTVNEANYIGMAVHTTARVCRSARRPDRDLRRHAHGAGRIRAGRGAAAQTGLLPAAGNSESPHALPAHGGGHGGPLSRSADLRRSRREPVRGELEPMSGFG